MSQGLGAITFMPVLIVLMVLAAGPTITHDVSANAFHEYCGRCHALPDVRAIEPPESMYNYARSFGATANDVAEIRAYVRSIRDE